ncbi:MAG: PQQ-dependent sugar dehydrogenase, partial [Chloroflexota bacterium]|nr:PQQ-dependent sugar dehydrogenase [Chloroflexota bacterium]
MRNRIVVVFAAVFVLLAAQLALANWGETPVALVADAEQVYAQQATPTPTEEAEEEEEEEAEATPAAPGDITRSQLEVPPVATPGGTLPDAPEIELVQVATGFVDPVAVVSPPDDTGRLFVVERTGLITIIDEDGTVLDEPFLDITGDTLSAFLEQGLYDIAFHPDFAENGRFYIHFAELLRNGDSMIVEYQVSEDNPNQADPESANAILQIDQPWANHNGGEIEFGPDGYLYIGSGDGGWEGDPLEAGQDLSTLLGKVLRIDVDAQAGALPYGIPEDNPFLQDLQLVELFGIPEIEFAQIHTLARPEIWHYGLRQPYTFSFDPETGDLWLPDVGQNHWEEINFHPAGSEGGVNYGWDFLMGSHCFPIEEEACPNVGVLPVAEYSHENGDCAVIDIGVSRQAFEELEGLYFASDFCSGRIWGIAQAPEAAEGEAQWIMQELLDTQLQVTGSGQDQQGELYVTSCNGCAYGRPPQPNGAVWR